MSPEDVRKCEKKIDRALAKQFPQPIQTNVLHQLYLGEKFSVKVENYVLCQEF